MTASVIKILVFQLFLFSLARFSLWVLHRDSLFADLSNFEFFASMLHGIRFDLSMIFILNGLFVLPMFLLPPGHFPRLVRLINAVFFLVSFAIGVMILMGFGYFYYAKRHAADEILFLFRDLNYAGTLLLALPFWLFPLCVIFVYSAWRIWGRFFSVPGLIGIRELSEQWSLQRLILSRLFGILLFASLATLAIRGGWQRKPIGLINAFLMPSPATAVLTMNSLFSSWHSVLNSSASPDYDCTHEKDPLPLIETSEDSAYAQRNESQALFSELDRLQLSGRSPHIIVIVLESFSNFYIDALRNSLDRLYTGEASPDLAPNITPNLDQLISESIAHRNFYAQGTRSLEAMQALFTGVPTLKGMPILTQGFEFLAKQPVAKVLSEMGYKSALFQAAKRGSFYFDSIASAIGFDFFFGEEDYLFERPLSQKIKPAFGWDHEAFVHLSKWLDTETHSGQPVLAYLFTGTMHSPYLSTEHDVYKDVGLGSEEAFLNTAAYTDWALGQWMKHAKKQDWYQGAVIFVTADHTLPTFRGFSRQDLYRVPLIIHSPLLKELQSKSPTIEETMDHLDLFEMVLRSAGIKDQVKQMGSPTGVLGNRRLISTRFGESALVTDRAWISFIPGQTIESVCLVGDCTEQELVRLTNDAQCWEESRYKILTERALN